MEEIRRAIRRRNFHRVSSYIFFPLGLLSPFILPHLYVSLNATLCTYADGTYPTMAMLKNALCYVLTSPLILWAFVGISVILPILVSYYVYWFWQQDESDAWFD